MQFSFKFNLLLLKTKHRLIAPQYVQENFKKPSSAATKSDDKEEVEKVKRPKESSFFKRGII